MKAATELGKIVRKRKRKDVNVATLEQDAFATERSPAPIEVAVGTTTIPTKTLMAVTSHDEPPSLRSPQTGSQCLHTLQSRHNESSPGLPSFTKLEQTHRALNLVFTFCCTRKHLATTFETIKGAVEGHIKRELKIEDVAAIVALRPSGINFAYVDEAMLQVDIRGAEKDDFFKGVKGKKSHPMVPTPDASVGGITGIEEFGSGAGEPSSRKGSAIV